MRKFLLGTLLTLTLGIAPGFAADSTLMEGTWTGAWTSDHALRDHAPVVIIFKIDKNTRIVDMVMAQVVPAPQPAFGSLGFGELKDDIIVIPAASSGIDGGGSEMVFFLQDPMHVIGYYWNGYDSGRFELRRGSPADKPV